MARRAWIGVCLLLASAAALPLRVSAQNPAGVVVKKDLVYFEGPAEEAARHRLDLYLPEGKKDFPLLMFVHGGAWKTGTKDLYRPLGEAFAQRGIGLAVPGYRLSPAVRHPEHVKDVARAFGWLSRNAKAHGADPRRLYLSGHSAGAHLVALLALDPRYLKAEGTGIEQVRGVIGVSGPYRLPSGTFPDVFGQDAATYDDAFPLAHVKDQPAEKVPPFLILYADQDYAGLPLSGRTLAAALNAHGAKATDREIVERNHISIIVNAARAEDPLLNAMVEFIKP
jgi:acetyl esterase/lipase